jgi:hypothetical protein
MQFKIHHHNQGQIAELLSKDIRIVCVQDALDLMGNADYQGARQIILREENLSPDFFNLSTRLAGDILQKFSNYDMSLAIVGDFDKYRSKSLQDFIRESNRNRRIIFVDSIEQVMEVW